MNKPFLMQQAGQIMQDNRGSKAARLKDLIDEIIEIAPNQNEAESFINSVLAYANGIKQEQDNALRNAAYEKIDRIFD